MKDYVSVIYAEKRTPKTDYPGKFIRYLLGCFNIKSGSKLLELGCGRGEFLKLFQDSGIDAYGIDISDFCSKNMPELKVKCMDILKDDIPYPDNFFDVVYHKSFLEHFYSPEKIMKETQRVLKPGGVTIILTPDWESQIKTFYEDFTHSRPYTKAALKRPFGYLRFYRY